MNTQDAQLVELVRDLIEWHKVRVEGCQLVIDKTDADISLRAADGREFTIKAGTEKARFIRLGYMLALEQFTPFPLSINENKSEDDFDDE